MGSGAHINVKEMLRRKLDKHKYNYDMVRWTLKREDAESLER